MYKDNDDIDFYVQKKYDQNSEENNKVDKIEIFQKYDQNPIFLELKNIIIPKIIQPKSYF